MAKKLKDTDYLFISTYLHSRERDLLTAARMERMIDAPTAEEAAKVLTEIGYGEFDASSQRELGQALAQEQEKLFQELKPLGEAILHPCEAPSEEGSE